MSKIGIPFAQVKDTVEQDRDMTLDAIRERMKTRLKEVGLNYTDLAESTGDPYKNVQRWFKGSTENIPADFVGRYIEAVAVNPRWLLTGTGPHGPVEGGTAMKLYDLIESVVTITESSLPPDGLNALLDRVTAILRQASRGGSGAGGVG